jgi:hypothetical protein
MAVLRLQAEKSAKSGRNCTYGPVEGSVDNYQWGLGNSSTGKQTKGWLTATSSTDTAAENVCYGVTASCIFLDPETLAQTCHGTIPSLPAVEDDVSSPSFMSSLKVQGKGFIGSLVGSTASKSFIMATNDTLTDHK